MIIASILYLLFSKQTNPINTTTLYKYVIIILTITIIPISIYLYKKYQRKENKIETHKLLLMIPLGISISLFYNMLTIDYIENKTIINLNIFILLLYSTLIGPIYEEIVFRYVSLRKAKQVYKENTAIILITIVFSLTHITKGMSNIIYALILGLLLSYVYKKHKNIIYPIVLHISANLTSFFIKEYNPIVLIISIITLIIYYIYFKNKK